MVLGATAMLGRADLIEIQVSGALANSEFTEEQLEQIPLFLLFYAGAGNTTALFRGIEAARATAKS
jgi:4-carboxymuconolactone decarboxylase